MAMLEDIPAETTAIAPVNDAMATMLQFAERAGLMAAHAPHGRARDLWTDAFAVCNFIELSRRTGHARFLRLAEALVQSVHLHLGKHGPDDAPMGALTKWMQALDQLARATGERHYNLWAHGLAHVCFPGFVRDGGSHARAHSCAPAMEHHPALDGWVTYQRLRATAATFFHSTLEALLLEEETVELARMIDITGLATADPLGIGGLLIDACFLAQSTQQKRFQERLLLTLLAAALEGLAYCARQGGFRQPAATRYPFRELGLAIGLSAVSLMSASAARGAFRSGSGLDEILAEFRPYLPLGHALVSFWRDGGRRASTNWIAQHDLNDVMLAASLVPDGLLVVRPLRAA